MKKRLKKKLLKKYLQMRQQQQNDYMQNLAWGKACLKLVAEKIYFNILNTLYPESQKKPLVNFVFSSLFPPLFLTSVPKNFTARLEQLARAWGQIPIGDE